MSTSPNLPFAHILTQHDNEQPFIAQYLACIISAITAALCITPIIAIVDKSVILSTTGKKSLRQAIIDEVKNLFSHSTPMWSSVEFQWVFAVYLLTYVTSNVSVVMFA